MSNVKKINPPEEIMKKLADFFGNGGLIKILGMGPRKNDEGGKDNALVVLSRMKTPADEQNGQHINSWIDHAVRVGREMRIEIKDAEDENNLVIAEEGKEISQQTMNTIAKAWGFIAVPKELWKRLKLEYEENAQKTLEWINKLGNLITIFL